MKYKVGDKVRVREDLIAGELYGKDVFASGMIPFKGQTVTIKKIQENKYLIEEDLEDWYWTDEMFSEKVSQDFIPKEPISQNVLPKEENSSNIIFTIKPIKAKLLLL